MKFWPVSAIAHSAGLPARHAQELANFYVRLPSEAAYVACIHAVDRMEPVNAPNLVIIETIGAPLRWIYTRFPEFDEWMRLERANVVEHNNFRFILVNALH